MKNKGFGNGLVYWESAQYNTRVFDIFKNRIMALAMNRYRWLNLPKTCNARWLEFLLLTQGCATIAAPKIKALEKSLYTLQCVQFGECNAYLNPKRWIARGANGRINFKCNSKNGVWIWDNMTRFPMMETIDIWARELVDVLRTKQMNRFHQKIPYILKCTNKQKNQAVNLIKQISGYEMAIITNEAFDDIEPNILNTGVNYLGEELTIEEQNIWSNIYAELGIKNTTYKSERMVQDEINTQNAPTDLMALNGLQTRREAAEKLNDIFGTNIQVVWNQDNISQNFNFYNNITEQVKGGDFDNGADTDL